MSRLVGVEVRRTLLRMHSEGHIDDVQFGVADGAMGDIESLAALVDISDSVCQTASKAFPTHLRSLDAIHLATAITVRDQLEPQLSFATHDRRLALNARLLGFEVAGVEDR
jgi:predicted nucleic acid-binding protein